MKRQQTDYYTMCKSLIVLLLVLLLVSPAYATLDPIENDAFGTLSTGYNSAATSIVASTGVGTLFPATFPYTVTWWNCTDYGAPHLDPSRERVRVTNRVSDTFTITRAQEGTSAVNHNTGGKTYCIVQALTKAMWNQIGTDIANAGGAINDVSDASSHADLNTAITALCAFAPAVKTLRISNTQILSANATVCPTVTVWIIGSGKISINSSVVLTIQAPVVAPVRKIFEGLGTVAGLTFSRGEWFGCVRDGVTDDSACLQKAIDAIATIGGQLNLGVGTYRITASLLIGNYVQMEGFGPAATFIAAGLTTDLIRSTNQATKYQLWHFKNFAVDNTTKNNVGGTCIDLTNVDNAVLDNVYVQNCETGVVISAGVGETAQNISLRNVDCLTTTTCLSVTKAEWLNVYDFRGNNATNCIDINDSTMVVLYGAKCEAMTNGIRVGNTTATAHTRIYNPFLKNTPTVGTGISIGASATRTFTFQPFYSGLTTNYTDASGDAIIWDAGFINGLRGVSESNVTSFDLNGTCTFAAATTCAVTFGNTMPDTSYKLQLGCNANKTFFWSAKSTTGFTLNASSSSSDVCDWWVSR